MLSRWTLSATGRAGFTLLELTVAIAIVVTLAAVVTPTLGSALDRARIERTQSTLESLSAGITRFRTDIGKYPRSLQQLAEPVVGSSATSLNSCGNQYTPAEASKWNGPYIGRVVSSAGLPTPVGTADNLLERNPTAPGAGGSSGVLMVKIPAVMYNDVVDLNTKVDGDGHLDFGRNNGSVRWTTPSMTNTVTLSWITPVNGC